MDTIYGKKPKKIIKLEVTQLDSIKGWMPRIATQIVHTVRQVAITRGVPRRENQLRNFNK